MYLPGSCRQVLAIKLDAFGSDHEETAVTLGNLAGVLRRTGQFAEALKLCRQALAVEERVYGPGHPEVAITVNNLAQVLKVLGMFDEAEAAHRRALVIFEVLQPRRGQTHITRT